MIGLPVKHAAFGVFVAPSWPPLLSCITCFLPSIQTAPLPPLEPSRVLPLLKERFKTGVPGRVNLSETVGFMAQGRVSPPPFGSFFFFSLPKGQRWNSILGSAWIPSSLQDPHVHEHFRRPATSCTFNPRVGTTAGQPRCCQLDVGVWFPRLCRVEVGRLGTASLSLLFVFFYEED